MSKKKQKELTTDTATQPEVTAEAPATAVATEPAPDAPPKAKRKRKEDPAVEAVVTDPAAPTPIVADPVPAETPTPKPKSKSKKPRTDVTLAQACDGYLRSLEDAGKSMGTCFSYKLELALAQRELGADTWVSDLTPERVHAFFVCDTVTKTRTGVLKADVSVAKTQRVLRQALVFAEKAGHVAKAPLPAA